MKWKRFTVASLMLITTISYWAWDNFHPAKRGPTTIRLAVDNPIETMDPALAYSDDSLLVAAQILEPLYQYHYLKRPYEIEPLLADGLPKIKEKGLIVEVKIKKDVTYHEHPAFGGKKRVVTAQDFITQIKRLALPELKSPGRSLFSGLIDGFDEFSEAVGRDWKKLDSVSLRGVRAVDDHTLEFRLLKPEPNIIYYLALNFIVPIPWELVLHANNNLSRVIVGTGPYEFRESTREYYRMTKFKDYRLAYYPSSGDRYANVQKLLDSSKEKIPFIDEAYFYIASEEQEGWETFLRGEIDLLSVPKTYLPKLYDDQGAINPELKEKGIELKHFPILANRWLAFNMRHPVVGKNENFRRAISHAIDYGRYIQEISQNTNLRANSILVPGISGYQPTKDFRYGFDLVRAKEYLALSGYKKASDIPVLVYSTRGNQDINIQEAKLIQDMLKEIGVKVEIQVLTFTEFLTKGRAGELMFFTDNWLFDYPDGENILQLLVSSNAPGINKSGYSNRQVDELYLKLKETTNIDQRDAIIRQMEDLVFDDLPWIPLMYESSFVLQQPGIKNFRKSSIIRNYVKYLKKEP